MFTLRTPTAALALGLAAIAGLAQAKDQAFHLRIAPGKVGEVCMPLAPGDTLRWRFKAGTAMDFNLHHHVGNEVQMPVDRKALIADKGELRIDTANDWCLMWTAPASAKPVSVQGTWSVVPAKNAAP